MPRSLGLSIPVSLSLTRNQSRPKYYPGEDILVNPESPPDSILNLSETISLNTSLSKTGKSDNKFVKYTIDNIQVSF